MKTLLKIVFPIFIIIAFQVNTHAQSEYWRQIFGGPFVDIAYNCIELRDGGYMMAGYKEIQVPGQIWQIPKSYVVKFDRNGNILWEKLIGDSITYNKSYTLIEDLNGNIFLSVYDGYAHLVKLNNNGAIIWDRDYSKYDIELIRGISFVESNNKLLMLSANTVNNYHTTTSITKLDTIGNVIWTKPYYDSIPTFGIYQSYDNSFLFDDKSYYISGSIGTSGFIVKTDTSGSIIWKKRFLDLYGIYSFAEHTNNTFLVSAYSTPGKLVCMKLDSSGNTIWKRNYINDTLAGAVGAEKIIKSSNNSFALGTPKGLNFGRLMIIDSVGNILISNFYYYPLNIGIYQNNINNTSDSGYIVSGYVRTYEFDKRIPGKFKTNTLEYPHGDKLIDVLVYKIDKFGNTVFIGNSGTSIPNNFSLNVYPNPFNNEFKISFSINKKSNVVISLFDILGRKVSIIENAIFAEGNYSLKVNTPDLSSGIYFLRTDADQLSVFNKIVLLK